MPFKDGSIFVVGYESGNPASYKVLTASEKWGREGWIMIDGPEPTDVLLKTTNGGSDDTREPKAAGVFSVCPHACRNTAR